MWHLWRWPPWHLDKLDSIDFDPPILGLVFVNRKWSQESLTEFLTCRSIIYNCFGYKPHRKDSPWNGIQGGLSLTYLLVRIWVLGCISGVVLNLDEGFFFSLLQKTIKGSSFKSLWYNHTFLTSLYRSIFCPNYKFDDHTYLFCLNFGNIWNIVFFTILSSHSAFHLFVRLDFFDFSISIIIISSLLFLSSTFSSWDK